MGKKVRPGKKYLDFLSYGLILGLMKSLQVLPLSLACWLGERLGSLWFYLDRRHRLITLDNMERAFGHELGKAQRITLAKKAYHTFGRVLIECLLLPSLTNEKIRDYVSISGIRNLREAAKQGKGILVLSAHFGNWELMAQAFALYGFPSSVVARPLDNPYLDRLLDRCRTQYGNRVIPKKGAARGIVKCLANKELVGILMDQNVSSREGVFVDFFGIPASTTPVLAALSQRTGAPVVPIFMVPKNVGAGYVVEIGQTIKLNHTGQKERGLLVNTARLTHVIEDYIRRYPHCWFWMHQRWKVRPEDQRQHWGKVRQVGHS